MQFFNCFWWNVMPKKRLASAPKAPLGTLWLEKQNLNKWRRNARKKTNRFAVPYPPSQLCDTILFCYNVKNLFGMHTCQLNNNSRLSFTWDALSSLGSDDPCNKSVCCLGFFRQCKDAVKGFLLLTGTKTFWLKKFSSSFSRLWCLY